MFKPYALQIGCADVQRMRAHKPSSKRWKKHAKGFSHFLILSTISAYHRFRQKSSHKNLILASLDVRSCCCAVVFNQPKRKPPPASSSRGQFPIPTNSWPTRSDTLLAQLVWRLGLVRIKPSSRIPHRQAMAAVCAAETRMRTRAVWTVEIVFLEQVPQWTGLWGLIWEFTEF